MRQLRMMPRGEAKFLSEFEVCLSRSETRSPPVESKQTCSQPLL